MILIIIKLGYSDGRRLIAEIYLKYLKGCLDSKKRSYDT